MIWKPEDDTRADVISSRLSGGMVAVVVLAVVVVALAFGREVEYRPDLEDAAIRQNIEAGREAAS